MTPHQADVAFVLEGVPGVLAVYAVAPAPLRTWSSEHEFEFAVHYEEGSSTYEAHCALWRVINLHKRPVMFFSQWLPGPLASRATPLMLTDRERESARRRVAPLQPKQKVPPAPQRLLRWPPPAAPFTVLLVDVGDEVHEALRRIFREESRHLLRVDQEAAADLALTAPFHLVVCSARAALATNGFLERVAGDDPLGADRVLITAPARDVPSIKWNLQKASRTNVVLALPIDDAILRHEAFRDHPALIARVAVADVNESGSQLSRPRFRRLRVLVVDEHPTTAIYFAAADPHEATDVVLATNALEAFEHLVSEQIDLVLCSATLRGDGGEPFYRVLWRLKPELKTHCVLVTPSDVAPPSTRILPRPLTRDAIAQVIETFTSR